MIAAIHDVLTEPSRFFKLVKNDRSMSKPWWHYVFVMAIFLIVYDITSLPGVVREILVEVNVGVGFTYGVTLIMLLLISALLLIFLSLGVFVSAGILHTFMRMVGSKRKYIQTFKVVCYGNTPMVFMGILGFFDQSPLFGALSIIVAGIFLGVYMTVLEVVGAETLHGLSRAKAVTAVLVLPLGLMVILCLISLVFFGVLVSMEVIDVTGLVAFIT